MTRTDNPDDVLTFWFGDEDTDPRERSDIWWGQVDDQEALDESIGQRFGPLHEKAADGQLEDWRDSPSSCLAYIIVLDQFSRNMYRSTPEAFAWDEQALEASLEGQKRGFDDELGPFERLFFYMPMMHSESLDIQDRALEAYDRLRREAPEEYADSMENSYDFAEMHYDLIDQFGRYPHRNAILGRESTDAERAHLREDDRSFGQPSFPDRVDRLVEHARETGALEPISTDATRVDDAGVDFLVWIVEQIERKEEATRRQREADGDQADPFAPPYDEDLFVEDVSETHVCLLNKFNVLDRHLLIATREYAEQTAPLDLDDLEALWHGLTRLDGLGFYNGGREAGASQPHKHLQLVGFPLGPDVDGVPTEALFADDLPEPGELGRSETLPFPHTLAAVDASGSPSEAARETLELYERMVDAHDLRDGDRLAPYNLLVTRDWMLLVPRSREKFDGMSVNSLGYAGSLLVRDDEELERLRDAGPMAVLEAVAE